MSLEKKVYYRIFPTEKLNFDLIKIDKKCNKVYIRHLQELAKNSMKKDASYWEFDTNGVFFNASQEQIYNDVMQDVLENLLQGYHGVIIAFGQAGAGKTFTTNGLHLSEEEFGLTPRIAKALLEIKRNQPSNIKMCIQLSCVEFYKNYAVDLLQELPNSLEIYKCREANKVKISNEFEALKCLYLAEGRKNYVEPNVKYLSNICSTVVTFHVTTKNMDLSDPKKICTRLHVIDLAGNDNCDNIVSRHRNPKDLGSANTTKLQLEQFISALTDNTPERIRIKQRMNTLIYYLGEDFSCENMLRFIGHIRGTSEDVVVSLSMLRFGYVIQGLKSKTKEIKFDMNEEVQLEYLRKKLDELEKEKHLNSVLLNQDLVSGLNQPRITHLHNLIEDYLKNDVNEVTVMNVAETKLVMQNLKEICTNCKGEVKKLQAENQTLLAQYQSDTNLKHRSSKSSSLASASKLSRRPSKVRSKESIKEKKVSSSTVSEKRPSADTSATTEVATTKRKKSKSTLSSTMKASAQSKKKSSTTSVRDSKESIKSSQELQGLLPDIVPEKQEVWKEFTNRGMYKDRVDDYKRNEKDVRSSYVEYVKEVKKLQTCKEAVSKACTDLIVAQTYRKFNSKDQYDADGLLITSFAEQECKAHIVEAEWLLNEQQEKVLKSQEELKLYLENRRSIVKGIEEDFDQFSRDNYKMPSSTSQEIDEDLKEYTFDANIEHPDDTLQDAPELEKVPEVSEKTRMIKKLRNLMLQEINKRKCVMNTKRNKWKNI